MNSDPEERGVISNKPSRPSDPPSAAKWASRAEPTCDHAGDAAAAELVSILDQFLADVKAGRTPSRQELMARHPALASQLEACLAGLEFIHGIESAAPDKPQRLGDFRIIREVGRGGMGAVFEAEQISLRRSVALKILRFGAISSPESIERFKREAETVAKLHHTNIVPVFNVGNEQGVNYYAMQFIEGRSLAEVLAEKNESLPASQVAEWGLQAAEALAHAHQRGVIHRDVKPSNLLLDRENRLWLTDFGLARRLDDVTLSLTGAILGTPRYMSPEQAAAHKRVDHRSDLFSLGATLYELLTGTPAFPGSSPQDVIQRILNSEPVPIRQLANSVPRDLETIVMKCLAKEPGRRYDRASGLAADLRDFLDGRPIRARRAGWVERATRWVKRQQQSVKLAATAASITLLLTVGGMLGWYGYNAWRQAAIKLSAATPPLVAEILDANGTLVRVETAPMQNAVQVPAGDYRIRVAAEGELSETFDLTLARGSESGFTLDLHDQLLWTPRKVEQSFDVVDFSAEQGVVLWNEKGIGLLRCIPPLGWTRELDAGHLVNLVEAPGFRWPWHQTLTQHSGFGLFDTRPWVSPRAVDIDGHGLGDLIVAARHQAWLMAVSGDDGKILWFAARGHDLAVQPRRSGTVLNNGVKSAMVNTPIFGHDCNGDGVSDVIATLMDVGPMPTLVQNRYAVRCWIEAISGKTGGTIWTYEIPNECFELPAGQEVPYDLRWFAGTSGGYMSGGGGSMNLGRHRTRYGYKQIERTGTHGYRPASVSLITVKAGTRVGVVAGTRYAALDPATGKLADQSIDSGPIELGARPGLACQWQDADGDGTSDLVLLERLEAGSGGTGSSNPAQARLVVWSPESRNTLWAKDLDARWPQQSTWTVEAPRWPLVVDLNDDEKCEIIVPHGSSDRSGFGRGGLGGGTGFPGTPWGAVVALAGSSGETLWTRRLVSMDQQIDHFVAGPDLDQDGYHEVYTVTLAGREFRAYIDALSGQKGNTLWTNCFAPPSDTNSSVEYHLAPPRWWQAGADGWPQLICHMVEGGPGSRRSLVGVVSSGLGRLTRLGHNITAVCPADIDGDGAEDLLVYGSRTPSALDLGGTLHCVRGLQHEPWARLGDSGEPIADLDGDGTRDLLAGWPSESLTATSGATGKVLWRSWIAELNRETRVRSASVRPGQSGDLNGDGTDDLLGWTHISNNGRSGNPFFAVSGKTGDKLWTSSDISIRILQAVCSAEAHDLDGDGKLEVLWLAALDYGYSPTTSISFHQAQLWLFVTSGQTGKLRWSHPLNSAYGQSPGNTMQVDFSQGAVSLAVGDLNGDGTSDLVVPELPAGGRTLQTVALSGKDGTALWSRPCPADSNQQVSLQNWIPPLIGDLDGDGRREVIVVDLTNSDASGKPMSPRFRVMAVHGHDGSEIWNWTSQSPSDYWLPPFGGNKGELMRPRLLRTGGKERRVAALLPGTEGAIVVVDHDGTAHVRKVNEGTLAAGIWSLDADGDGVDEVAFLDQSLLCVARADRLDQLLWTPSPNYQGQQRILGVLSRGEKRSPIVAVARDGSDNSVYGFDAATGRRDWTCPGVISRDATDGSYFVPRQIALLDGQASTPPHVYYSYGAVSRCRRGISLPTAESYLSTDDDRWGRYLPWAAQQVPLREFTTMVLWSSVFAALLVVLPLAFLARLVALRHFGLRMLLATPVVAGLFVTAWLIRTPIDRELNGLVARLWLGLTLSPVVVAVGRLLWWLATGQWRRSLHWLVTSLVVSFCCALVFLWGAMPQEPLLPEEYYDLTDWYQVWFIGAYLTSWMLLVALPLNHLVVRVLSRLRHGHPSKLRSKTPQLDPTQSR